MTHSLPDTTEYLQLGINAARSGDKQAARKYLSVVLRADPNSVPALFWLAFVAPSPQASEQLLQRVLRLEPDNARAKAGIAWARQQLQASAEPAAEEAEPPPVVDRRELLSDPEVQKQAQKAAKAHRARRNINPFLGVLLLVGVGLIAAGGWALAFVPPDTLAAWLPAVSEAVGEAVARPSPAPAIEPNAGAALPQSEPTAPKPPSFTSLGDTVDVPVQMSQMPRETLTVPDVTGFFEPASEIPAIAVSTILPAEFVGPDKDGLGGPKLFEPVDENLLVYRPSTPEEKWIAVDVTNQRVTAWEGNVPVMTFLSSTGLPGTPTVLGQYNIYWKLESTLMTGPGYYLPDVPYTMYFYAGYALHGAYWHDNFGQPMSHGCVNLSNDNAKSLFEWAGPVMPPGQRQVTATFDNPGTLVVVHQ